jgi:hypothetical protein
MKTTCGRRTNPALKWVEHPNYLGDRKVVYRLLRGWAGGILTSDHEDHDALLRRIDRATRTLSRVFLGMEERYPGTGWNRPGAIDAWLAERVQLHPDDGPHERIGSVLLNLLKKLYMLQNDVNEHSLLPEQWQPVVDCLLDEYTDLMMCVEYPPEEEEEDHETPGQRGGNHARLRTATQTRAHPAPAERD